MSTEEKQGWDRTWLVGFFLLAVMAAVPVAAVVVEVLR